MSVTAYVETRERTNVLTVPIASVTTRLPKEPDKKGGADKSGKTNAPAANATNAPATHTNATASARTNTASGSSAREGKSDKKAADAPKPIEVVFVRDGDKVKMVPVKIGISDEDYWEITEGLKEDEEVVSGGYKAINRELEDGKKIRIGKPEKDEEKEKK
jgi:HlyD family secretion protein